MECILCKMWARMPHALRPTTPTTCQDTEGALVVGYWVGKQEANKAPPMCQRHLTAIAYLDKLDENEKRSRELQAAKPAEPTQPSILTDPTFRSVEQILNHPGLKAIGQTDQTPFKLGPGPLTNENTVTVQPPLPIQVDIVRPYTGLTNDVKITVEDPTKPVIDPVQMALDAAKMPAVEGKDGKYPCPLCGVLVGPGEVHTC